MKILIVKLSSLGDIVHTLPLVNVLKENLENISIDWVVEESFCSLLRGHPSVNEVIVLGRKKRLLNNSSPFLQMLRELRKKRYDYVLDLQGNSKGSLVVVFARARKRMGFSRGSFRTDTLSTFFTNLKVSEEGTHVIEKNLSFAKAIGVERKDVSFGIPVPRLAREKIEGFLKSNNIFEKEIGVIHPGVTWVSKRWPLDKFVKLAESINLSYPDIGIVITVGRGEENLGEEFRRRRGSHVAVFEKRGLLELVALLERCKLFIGSDTGPLHLASALGRRVVGLYGPTDPARNGPYGDGNFVVMSEKKCSGCWKRSCEDINCMEDIGVEDVMAKVALCLSEAVVYN